MVWFIACAALKFSGQSRILYTEEQLVSQVSASLSADGYPGPIQFVTKSVYSDSNTDPSDLPSYSMTFSSRGIPVYTQVRQDGAITRIVPSNLGEQRGRSETKVPTSFDKDIAWSIFRRLKLEGDWKLDQIMASSGGWMARFYRLGNGLRVVNLNPSYRYEISFNTTEQIAWLDGNPVLPELSNPTPEVTLDQAREKLEAYYRATKIGIFAPTWPNPVEIRPELAYYKFAKEPKARLVYLPRVFQSFNGTDIFSGDYNMIVDAHTGEVERVDDVCWN